MAQYAYCTLIDEPTSWCTIKTRLWCWIICIGGQQKENSRHRKAYIHYVECINFKGDKNRALVDCAACVATCNKYQSTLNVFSIHFSHLSMQWNQCESKDEEKAMPEQTTQDFINNTFLIKEN